MSLILSGTDGLSDVDGSAATPAIRGTDANTGIFFPAADTIAFSEGGVEAMRIDSSGNVGIGVTPSNAYTAGKVVQVGVAGGATLYGSSTTLSLSSNTNLDAAGAFTYARTSTANYYQQVSGEHRWANAPSGTAGNTITFTQAMTLDASGNLLVGTTSTTNTPTQGFVLNNNTSAANIGIGHATGTSNGSTFINFCYNGSQIGTIYQATTSTVFYQTTSDYRLKENVKRLENGLDTVLKLNPVTYTWKRGGEHDEGFIAHEVKELMPNIVYGEKDALNEDSSIKPQGIDYGRLTPFLAAAIQEQQVLIQSLTTRIAVLEAK
jgi:hypothetical protein